MAKTDGLENPDSPRIYDIERPKSAKCENSLNWSYDAEFDIKSPNPYGVPLWLVWVLPHPSGRNKPIYFLTPLILMKDYIAIYKELSIEQIERDIDQPRKDFGVEGEENRLLLSMKEIGIQQPLVVCAMAVGWKGRCADDLFPLSLMVLTPEQLKAGIEYFQILRNVKRRLILEERQKEAEKEKKKPEDK